MALIKCPNCGEEVSDKAEKCIHCGAIIEKEPIPQEEKHCEECGAVLSNADEICPKCGCPVKKEESNDQEKAQKVEVTAVKVPVSKRTKGIVVAIVAIIIICIVGFVAKKTIDDNNAKIAAEEAEKKAKEEYEQAYNKYIDGLNLIQVIMLGNGAKAEDLCNLTLKVWRACIFHEPGKDTNKYALTESSYKYHGDSDDSPTSSSSYRDFNEGLMLLVEDKTEEIASIQKNLDNVKTIMSEMKDVPEGLEECSTILKNLYDAYKDLCNLATNPTGSYSSFGESKQDAVSRFMDYYEDLGDNIPEKIKVKSE